MREIKFRAWDTERKQFYQPVHEAYQNNLFELFISFSGDLSAHTMKGMEHESLWAGRYELMQYTGLKDKSGVEIYEGDILQVADRTYTVCWNEGGAFFDLAHPDDTPMGTDYLLSEAIWGWKSEVIGNIYENPELLKGDTKL